MGPNKAVPAELASAVSDTASQSRQPAEPSGYPTEILLQHSLMKWLLPFAVAYIVYALAFALMFRCSNLCYMSDDPDVPQGPPSLMPLLHHPVCGSESGDSILRRELLPDC